ncbi:MAG: pyruvate formate-lyase-activating protein [Oscillospiraceae bacterium]
MTGRIHSIQTLGTLDGPGLRFVLFLQGCPLRCIFCHNPDSWDMNGGTVSDSKEIFEKVRRYKTYFRNAGGITVSGGEPLVQAEFVRELFEQCKEAGIHTCLDTSGCMLTPEIEALIDVTDLFLLDIKMPNDALYRKNIGCSLESVKQFLDVLEAKKKTTWVRQVIILGINDTMENISDLHYLTKDYRCVRKIELLPFKKMCLPKYESMGIPFPLAQTLETDFETIERLTDYLAALRK